MATSSNSLMLGEMGLTGLNGIANILVGNADRSVQRIMDKYNNTMAALSAAQANNQVTRNEASLSQQVKLAEAGDQVATMQATESAKVAAAAAGVSGNSVAVTLNSFARGKAQKEMARNLEETQVRGGLNDQRRSIAVQKAYGKSSSIMPSTSATSLLGLGASLLDVYKQHQPSTYDIGG